MRGPLALFVVALLPSCEILAMVDCDCSDQGITLVLPSGDAGAIDRVTASGSACSNVSPTCDGVTCRVPTNGEGTCEIVVTYTDGALPWTTSVPVALSGSSSCCVEYRPVGDAGTVGVPRPGDAS
jgi:hypothetical protein